jgi:CheY-like chemotaxis protein
MTQRQLRVSVDVGQDHVSVPEEQAVLLFQSVRELLMNVAKHAGTKHASVHLRCEDRGIRLEVRDAGAGFDLSVVRPQDGGQPLKFGLLSIRERMKAFGGRLELVTAPGKGTTALLVLPLQEGVESQPAGLLHHGLTSVRAAVREQVHEQPTSDLMPSVQRALTVLLVDDHAMMRQGLRSVLEAHADIQIVGEASDGHEAVAMADTLRPAVVIMDINMPRLNGIEATSRIKAQYPDIRVIGLSVNAGPNNKEAMLKAGADMLLTKEAAVEELYRGIQRIVQHL